MENRTYTADPALEVSGLTTLSFVNNLDSSSFAELISKHGLEEIDTEAWYPLNKVFGLFNDIAAENRGSSPFVAMGMKIAEQSPFPPELRNQLTLTGILEGWHDHYEASHRGGTLPEVLTEKVDDQHYKLILPANHLYPFNLVYGMAYGFCRLLLPQGTNFKVKYDETHTPYGDYGDKVVIHVSWE